MEIRTLLAHDSPLSVYCLMPQIKCYCWKMSVGNLRRLFFFFCIPFNISPHTVWVFGSCIQRWDGLIDQVSNPVLSTSDLSRALHCCARTSAMFSNIHCVGTGGTESLMVTRVRLSESGRNQAKPQLHERFLSLSSHRSCSKCCCPGGLGKVRGLGIMRGTLGQLPVFTLRALPLPCGPQVLGTATPQLCGSGSLPCPASSSRQPWVKHSSFPSPPKAPVHLSPISKISLPFPSLTYRSSSSNVDLSSSVSNRWCKYLFPVCGSAFHSGSQLQRF